MNSLAFSTPVVRSLWNFLADTVELLEFTNNPGKGSTLLLSISFQAFSLCLIQCFSFTFR